jgi:hypothetical protein
MSDKNYGKRRSFLKTTAAGAIGLGSLASLARPAQADAQLDVTLTHQGAPGLVSGPSPADYEIEYTNGSESGTLRSGESDSITLGGDARLESFRVDATGKTEEACNLLLVHDPASTLNTTVDGRVTVESISGKTLYKLHAIEGGELQIYNNDLIEPEEVYDSSRFDAGKVGDGQVSGGGSDDWDLEGQFEAIELDYINGSEGVKITRDIV